MSSAISRSLIGAAMLRLPEFERPALQVYLQGLTDAWHDGCAHADYLEILRRADASNALKTVTGLIHHRCRAVGEAGFGHEVATLLTQLQALPPGLDGIGTLAASDGRFIQAAYETVLGRGCQAHELLLWRARIESGEITREGVLAELHDQKKRTVALDAARASGGGEWSFQVMGTAQRVTRRQWDARVREIGRAPLPARLHTPRWRLEMPPRVRVSAITSLYRGGEYIERFLQNMVRQSCFRDHAELVIVDADSPDGEAEIIRRYQRRHANIKYLRTETRIGIYEAWNLALGLASGDYLTSANVDDLRREDSLEQQAGVLERLPFVDVVYQDFFYTLDPTLPFEQIAAMGFRSALPLVTPYTMMSMNPPHNAPMWRRHLHQELGLFDSGLASAGDYDFWMRCLVAGKTFYKLSDPHVAYFHNPGGLSTRPGSRGHAETREVHRRYGRQLVSDNLVMSQDAFRRANDLPAALSGGHQEDLRTVVHRALRTAAAANRAAPT